MPKALRSLLLAAIYMAAVVGCRPATVRGPLPQRAYLWQRAWTPAVVDSLGEIERRMDGVVILGAEIVWQNGAPTARRGTIDWDALARVKMSRALAVRIAPFAGPFSADDATARFIAATVKSLADEAVAHGVKLTEMQLDFDCAQRKLAGYQLWLGRVRTLVRPPMRLVITTLPAWLDEPDFVSLVQQVDGYVLQVHSVPTRRESGRVALFEPELARRWVRKAAKLGKPFGVALPTYRCLAGYDPEGKLLGVYMDSVPPKWPAGTTTLEFAADADAIADVVHGWQTSRPRQLRELLWYRAPVASDVRNWRWPTLAAVMAGRHPRHDLRVLQDGVNPIDLSVFNAGEAEEPLASIIAATWSDGDLEAADALEGWSVVGEARRVQFIPQLPSPVRLAPGARRSIGWLRFAQPTTLEIQVEK